MRTSHGMAASTKRNDGDKAAATKPSSMHASFMLCAGREDSTVAVGQQILLNKMSTRGQTTRTTHQNKR